MLCVMTTTKLRLHAFSLSGHAHRAELFLSLLGLPYERIEVDLVKGVHKLPDFLAMNPFGQVPVLEDGDVVLSDSNAILVYLAMRYDTSGRWLPRDPVVAARIQRWFSVAAGELANGPGAARLVALFGAKLDHDRARAGAGVLFGIMEAELGTRAYLASDAATLADVALYSYTLLAPEGGVSLDGYPNVRAWLGRVEELPGFKPMVRSRSAA
jgi:glutathione S-transferase